MLSAATRVVPASEREPACTVMGVGDGHPKVCELGRSRARGLQGPGAWRVARAAITPQRCSLAAAAMLLRAGACLPLPARKRQRAREP